MVTSLLFKDRLKARITSWPLRQGRGTSPVLTKSLCFSSRAIQAQLALQVPLAKMVPRVLVVMQALRAVLVTLVSKALLVPLVRRESLGKMAHL